jgi:hypothetical protein
MIKVTLDIEDGMGIVTVSDGLAPDLRLRTHGGAFGRDEFGNRICVIHLEQDAKLLAGKDDASSTWTLARIKLPTGVDLTLNGIIDIPGLYEGFGVEIPEDFR